MFFQSLTVFGIMFIAIGFIFYFPDFGVLGHIFSDDGDSRKAQINLRPAAKVILSIGMISGVLGGLGLFL